MFHFKYSALNGNLISEIFSQDLKVEKNGWFNYRNYFTPNYVLLFYSKILSNSALVTMRGKKRQYKLVRLFVIGKNAFCRFVDKIFNLIVNLQWIPKMTPKIFSFKKCYFSSLVVKIAAYIVHY